MKRSKRYRNNEAKLEEIKDVSQALDFLLAMNKVKFDETLEVHVNLNIDPKKSEQNFKFSLNLPHGTGKKVKVAVFAEGTKAKEAEASGADVILGEADIERIKNKKRKLDFDIVIADPSMMPKLAKIAKILGPKGLMPSPKNNTVTKEIKDTVELLKKGMVTVKNDPTGVIHQALGKFSFGKKKLLENYKDFIEKLEKNRPQKVKGKMIKRLYLTSTMGPSIKIKD
ncbi:MAG: 50S ribosomal protein L1 [Candidatus Moranbacteria bacterium]|nr:50S ribosomal protein L1 [Candidatus Moranbacteria bacterium]